ncbi:MAG TPA: hypothetical protein VM925_30615 [Labilithrix sp.]|nr:hypothetical protein [Labilithrix sp.]
MKRWFKALATMAVMLTFLGDDCSGVSVEDPSFRLWTSDTSLSAWDVTAGSIRKAPTWSEADPGVEFVETPTAIAQKLTSSAACAKVVVMGKVDENADLEILAGNLSSFKVPKLDWAEYVDYLSIPAVYDADAGSAWYTPTSGAVLKIRKNGPGKVILSKIDVQSGSGCGPSTYGE